MNSKNLKTFNEIKLMRLNQKQRLKYTEDQIKARLDLVYQNYKLQLKGELVKRGTFMIFNFLGKKIMHRFSR
ncbi:MAG: hypothetical protein KUL83_02230 [Lentimicrobium sp.]|jgi:hypothetical protein|nr:hypothetical protein [Lentimicrobium sp.]MDD4597168.1 hypothetical protein [Lentimicrobiaceae bacterium]MDY0025398.1 hypothetical protein [Lentimicrobium sp.]